MNFVHLAKQHEKLYGKRVNKMNKIKIVCGEFKIGDLINGKKIISFSKSWIESRADKSNFKGQIWEPCRCGQEPVYLESFECEKCINRNYGKPTNVCYAYLDNEEIEKDEK